MRWYTVVDHLQNNVHLTKNLKDFCTQYELSYDNMQYNARTRKTLYKSRWSCRCGKLEGSDEDIIKSVDNELRIASSLIKSSISKCSRKGEKNPMFNKKHTAEAKQKISETKRKRNEKS